MSNGYNDFITQLKKMIREETANLHTALPGEIVEVNTETGLVNVLPKAEMKFSNGKVLEYPIISNVPLVYPFSSVGNAALAYPVKVGDQCLIVFSEQSVDKWLGYGSISYELKHGLGGAICIPGAMKTISPDFKEAVETDSVIIRNGDCKITLKDAQITLCGDVTVEGNINIRGEITSL